MQPIWNSVGLLWAKATLPVPPNNTWGRVSSGPIGPMLT